mmetsp:Transcript_47674/g.85823  ORF Transcript_47674/g.85823 Transcript_47674/m.85823 type:complete len:589 (-) Transcript_47674:76-1842(-)
MKTKGDLSLALPNEQSPLAREVLKGGTGAYGFGGASKPENFKVQETNTAFMPAACFSILVVECCERLAFYTFVGTQEFFLEQLGYTVSQAASMNAAMGTLCMAWALLGGWAADVTFGRYQTIVGFGLIYALGAFLAAASAWPGLQSTWLYMVGIMILVPLGTAGIKANISNFGADQYDTSTPAGLAAQERFFSWFYMSINLGSAVAYGYLTTLGSSGGLGIPKQYGYFAVYAIAAVFMVTAIAVFCSKRDVYHIRPLQHSSSLGSVAQRVSAVAETGSVPAKFLRAGVVLLVAAIGFSVLQAVAPSLLFASSFTRLAFLCAGAGVLMVVLPCRRPSWLVSEPFDARPGDFSDADIRDFLRLLPIIFTGNLAFSALFNSMMFWYQQQACQMDLRAAGTQLSGSFFCVADCLAIIVATPLAMDWVNPFLEQKCNFGHRAKFGVGMAVAALSVLSAAHLELLRKMSPVLMDMSNCAPPGTAMSSMPASWMIVPFFLMGIGEIYTQPVLMHLSYSQSPKSMRTLTAATSLVVGAVSNALFTVQVTALAPLVPNDLNRGHLEYGYYFNVVLGGCFYMAYLAVLNGFEEKQFNA